MKKIIHLSDLHIGASMAGKYARRFENIVQNMGRKIADPENYIIVITGDLVDVAYIDTYEKAKISLDTLHGFGFKEVFIAPGNHDFSERFGVAANKTRVKMFNRIFFGVDQIDYPDVRFSKDRMIAFIGVNSLQGYFASRQYSVMARGKIGAEQLRKLENRLTEDPDVRNAGRVVVYLHHHPFNGLRKGHKLMDAYDFLKVILRAGNVDALLFGHNHFGYDWNGFLESVHRCYDAGSSTRRQKKKDQISMHRVMDLAQNRDTDYDGNFH